MRADVRNMCYSALVRNPYERHSQLKHLGDVKKEKKAPFIERLILT
jgi:hypothetical protein